MIWTETLVRRLGQRVREGLSSREIAIEMGLSKGAVAGKRWRLRNGADRTPRDDLWTAQQIAFLKRAWRRGKTDRQIAEALGKPVYGVGKKRRQYCGVPNLEPRKPPTATARQADVQPRVLAPWPKGVPPFNDVPVHEQRKRDRGLFGKRIIGPWPAR